MQSSRGIRRNWLPLIFANVNRLKLDPFNAFLGVNLGERKRLMSCKYVV